MAVLNEAKMTWQMTLQDFVKKSSLIEAVDEAFQHVTSDGAGRVSGRAVRKTYGECPGDGKLSRDQRARSGQSVKEQLRDEA